MTTRALLARTRGGVLPDEVKTQLHLDIEDNIDSSFHFIYSLPKRNYSQYPREAVRNRHNYLLKLKRQDPKRYWELYLHCKTNKPIDFAALRKDLIVNISDWIL